MTGTQFNEIIKNLEGIKNNTAGGSGIGIADIEINTNGELVITLTDGTVKNLGKVVGKDGKDGQFTVQDSGNTYSVELRLIDSKPVLVTTLIPTQAEEATPEEADTID